MPTYTFKPSTISLLLLASTFFNQSHAKPKQPNSHIIGMIHSRAFDPRSATSKPLEAFDMIEPMRGSRDGYLISLNLGTPPQVLQVYMDTGSDLTWVPCGNIFDCMECDEYYKDYKLASSFSPSRSTSSFMDLCASDLCSDVHSSDNPYDPCSASGCSLGAILNGGCPRPCPSFAYTYGEGVVVGSLTRDTLRVHGGDDSTTVTREIPGFCFGCVGSTFREPIGIVGFGRGPLSLPSQLGFIQLGFSHCFLGFKFANNPNKTSPLVVGYIAISSNDQLQFTPMLKNFIFPNYYYIGLEGIGVGDGTTIEAPLELSAFDSEGNGGMLIDSGTTYTHLPDPFYSRLLEELGSKIAYPRSSESEQRTGFDLCYKVPISNNSDDQLPTISFHFVNNVELTLPTESCFYAVGAPRGSMVVKCLLFQRMEDGGFGPAGVFGSFQQQNVEVVYDLEEERVGFQTMDCASSAAYHGLH